MPVAAGFTVTNGAQLGSFRSDRTGRTFSLGRSTSFDSRMSVRWTTSVASSSLASNVRNRRGQCSWPQRERRFDLGRRAVTQAAFFAGRDDPVFDLRSFSVPLVRIRSRPRKLDFCTSLTFCRNSFACMHYGSITFSGSVAVGTTLKGISISRNPTKRKSGRYFQSKRDELRIRRCRRAYETRPLDERPEMGGMVACRWPSVGASR